MRKFLYTLIAVGMIACGEKKNEVSADTLIHNDFDTIDGWMNSLTPPPSLTKERAHSGLYSIKVDPANAYSLSYINQLGRISSSKLRKIKVHAWVNIPNNRASATLVTEVNDATGKNVFWGGLSLSEGTKDYNKWVEVEKTFTLPENIAYTDFLKLYLWRGPSDQPAYVDDLGVTKVE